MKTRSKGTLESGLKRKIPRVASTRETEQLKLKTDVSDLTKTPAGKEIRLRTPKSREKRLKAATPRRDDLICSQHFDSQVVVGWDCNSPDSLRDLRKLTSDDDAADLISRLINDEPEDAVVPKRSTPPLLGMWREADKKEDNRSEKNALLPIRFKKRGRTRRKSAKDSVSQALLQKLEKALDKCSETDKVTEVRSTEAELFLSDCDEEEEEETNTNASGDLFDSTANVTSVKEETTEIVNEAKQTLNEDATDWSDDELFGDDSFLIKPTQLSNEAKKSQVFGMKRKPFRDSDLPQSKCSRVSVRHDNTRQPSLVSTSTDTRGARFTAITAKPPLPSCDSRLTVNSNTHYSNARTGLPSTSYSTFTPNLSSTVVAKTLTSHSRDFKPQNSFNSSKKHIDSNIYNKTETNLSNNRSTTMQSKPVTSNARSFYPSSVSRPIPTNNQITQSRASAFKKHSSFSGTDSVSQSYASNRKRSISGNTDLLGLTKQISSISENMSGSNPAGNVYNTSGVRNGQHLKTQTSLSNNMTLNNKPRTATSGANSSYTSSKNVTSDKKVTENGPRLSSGAFDTSITDDLLCQLAEPDEILDSQVELPKLSNSTAVTPSAGGRIPASNLRVETAGRRDGHNGGKTGAVSTSNKSDSTVMKSTVSKSGPPHNSHTKQYRFRDSQNSAVAKAKAPSVLPSNVSKMDTTSTLPKSTNQSTAGPVSTVKQHDKHMEDFSDDVFDDEFSDDDGLTEPQILAMLDEAEFLATQQCAMSSPKGKQDPKANTGASSSQGCISNSQDFIQGSPSYFSNSQDKVFNSQGFVSGSQTKYTAEEIERKKMEAIQKRKLRSQVK